MRRIAGWLAFLWLMMCFLPAFAEDIPEPTPATDAVPYDAEHPELLDPDQLWAVSAILIDAHSGNVIFEKNADEPRAIASTTKIMTVLLGLMTVDPDTTVTVNASALEVLNREGSISNMSLKEGEEINFLDLCYGTMVRSANEGANVIAETVSGSQEAFVDLMNEYAQVLGCTNTHFMNANGLDQEGHYSTARDLAIIAREAMQNETFRQIARTTEYTIPRTNMLRSRNYTTSNRLMLPGTEESPNKYYYPYAIGIKTGTETQAGYCLVAAAEKDGVELISVTLFSGRLNLWVDNIKLFNYGFAHYVSVTPVDIYNMNPLSINMTGFSLNDPAMGEVQLNCIPVDAANNPRITVTTEELDAMAHNLRSTVLIDYTRTFEAPVSAGEVMGTMTYFQADGTASDYELTASRSVARRENAPKTIAEITAETEADPNPLPRLSVELVLFALSPLLLLALLILLIVALVRRRKRRSSHIPQIKNRYLK